MWKMTAKDIFGKKKNVGASVKKKSGAANKRIFGNEHPGTTRTG